MVKYEFTAARVIVPPLTHFKIVEGIGAVKKGLDLSRHSIGSLVGHTVNFIQGQKNNVGWWISDLLRNQIDLNKLEALDRTDFRQLESYLSEVKRCSMPEPKRRSAGVAYHGKRSTEVLSPTISTRNNILLGGSTPY
ncbi:hypothetical protein EDD21DRAFT_349419 [Dissophora ornata]|nr:hypothetical protein EDD21DRAFT_349419 [Dissophora ornata]